jgi:hypothetical protein
MILKAKKSYEFSEGKMLYQERARMTLPYLVRLAKARRTIYYSDLAEALNIPNPRNFNKILDSIENGLKEVMKNTKMKIPRIQDIVISKTTHLPGYYSKESYFKKLSTTDKKKRLEIELFEVYTFNDWDFVLSQLGLKPLKSDIRKQLLNAKIFTSGRIGGESKEHKLLKEYISRNPKLIKIKSKNLKVELEYKLPSADTIDILFSHSNMKIAVEVKSRLSDTSDILRGLFQCVKYKYLIEAEQVVNNITPNSRVVLVLESSFPIELELTKNILNIEVIDNIRK